MKSEETKNYFKPKHMTSEEARTMLSEICAKHAVVLHYMTKDDGDGDNHNKSFCAGREIYLGIYEDIELEVISFFHELAHVIFDYDRNVISTMQYELYVTYKGLEYAEKECEVLFSDDAIKWILEQCLTYCGWDEREIRGYKF